MNGYGRSLKVFRQGTLYGDKFKERFKISFNRVWSFFLTLECDVRGQSLKAWLLVILFQVFPFLHLPEGEEKTSISSVFLQPFCKHRKLFFFFTIFFSRPSVVIWKLVFQSKWVINPVSFLNEKANLLFIYVMYHF